MLNDSLPTHRVRDDLKMIVLTGLAILLCILAIIFLSFLVSSSLANHKFILMSAGASVFYERIDTHDFNLVFGEADFI